MSSSAMASIATGEGMNRPNCRSWPWRPGFRLEMTLPPFRTDSTAPKSPFGRRRGRLGGVWGPLFPSSTKAAWRA
eukprot:5681382-Prymnesium_polylepis.1